MYGVQVWRHCSMLVVWTVMAEDQRREHWRLREQSEKWLTCRGETSVAVQMSVAHLLCIDESITGRRCIEDRLLILILLTHTHWRTSSCPQKPGTVPVHWATSPKAVFSSCLILSGVTLPNHQYQHTEWVSGVPLDGNRSFWRQSLSRALITLALTTRLKNTQKNAN